MPQPSPLSKQDKPAPPSRAAGYLTGTPGLADPATGERLVSGSRDRRRNITMEVRPRPGDLDPPKPEHVAPLVAEILTLALIAKASSDLQRTHQRTQLSKTDIVNRAISFYEFADAEHHAGSELLLRRATGEVHVVKLL